MVPMQISETTIPLLPRRLVCMQRSPSVANDRSQAAALSFSRICGCSSRLPAQPEAVETAGRLIGQVERGRAEAADAGHPLADLVQLLQEPRVLAVAQEG